MTEIESKYNQVIASGYKLGKPTNNESICADGKGRYRHYEGGSLFWSGQPGTPAYLTYGLIQAKWAAMGWERSHLGYPTTDEMPAGSQQGSRYNNFQNGIIMWKGGSSEAFAIYGAIYRKWAEQGYDVGYLGLPVTDELGIPGSGRKYNYFEGGAIIWNAKTGAAIFKGAKKSDKKVAFVLSGGGAKGDFQLGALAALYEAGIRPDIICGSSVGALNGLMLAQGESGLDELKRIWFGLFRNDHMWTLDDWWNEVDPTLRDPVVSALRGEKSTLNPFFENMLGGGLMGGLGGMLLFGPFGALFGLLSGSVPPAIDKVTQFIRLITTKARALLNIKPIKKLFDAHINMGKIDQWIAEGRQLRLAVVGLGSGELCYVTETGDLIDRNQKKVLRSGISIMDGTMASASIASIFPPVKFADDSWVDGGHREILPLQAALDAGATEVYVICTGNVIRESGVNYGEEGYFGPKDSYKTLDGATVFPYDYDNKCLVDIAVRAILDITGDEVGRNDVYSIIDSSPAKIHLIKPTFPTHDLITVDPNLIRVNYHYGYRAASDVITNANSELSQLSDQIALKQSRVFRLRKKTWKGINIPFANEIDALNQEIDRLANLRRNAGAKVNGPDVANPFPAGDSMQCGDLLLPNQSIVSANGQFVLIYQTDGNLVLYDDKAVGGRKPIWASDTAGKAPGCCVFKCEGNLVIYDPAMKNPVWDSNKFFAPEHRMKHDNILRVQSDGNVVIYERELSSRRVVWQTKRPPVIVTPTVRSVSIDNRTSMNARVNFFNNDLRGIPAMSGIANARVVTSFNLPAGPTDIWVDINGSNSKKLSAGATYIFDIEERIRIFNDTNLPVTVRFYEPGELVFAIPLLGVKDSTYTIPARSDWYWMMPDHLTKVKCTFNNRNSEARVLDRGVVARWTRTTNILIRNDSGRKVRFLFFEELDASLISPFIPGGDKEVSASSTANFVAPPNVLDKVQVRVDVKPKGLGDNRKDAQKVILDLGSTLIYKEDGTVTVE